MTSRNQSGTDFRYSRLFIFGHFRLYLCSLLYDLFCNLWRFFVFQVFSDVTKPVLDFYRQMGILEEFQGTESKVIYPKVEKFLTQRFKWKECDGDGSGIVGLGNLPFPYNNAMMKNPVKNHNRRIDALPFDVYFYIFRFHFLLNLFEILLLKSCARLTVS